jgi:hypothetical protein
MEEVGVTDIHESLVGAPAGQPKCAVTLNWLKPPVAGDARPLNGRE